MAAAEVRRARAKARKGLRALGKITRARALIEAALAAVQDARAYVDAELDTLADLPVQLRLSDVRADVYRARGSIVEIAARATLYVEAADEALGSARIAESIDTDREVV